MAGERKAAGVGGSHDVVGGAPRARLPRRGRHAAPAPALLPGRGRALNGSEAARQTTDSQGNYRIGVAPGNYQVVGLPPNGSSGLPAPPAPQPVTVVENQYVTVNVSYDTGIR